MPLKKEIVGCMKTNLNSVGKKPCIRASKGRTGFPFLKGVNLRGSCKTYLRYSIKEIVF